MNQTSFSLGKDSRFKDADPQNMPSPNNYNPTLNLKATHIKFGTGNRGELSPSRLNNPGPGT